jgi:hypothetical protein
MNHGPNVGCVPEQGKYLIGRKNISPKFFIIILGGIYMYSKILLSILAATVLGVIIYCFAVGILYLIKAGELKLNSPLPYLIKILIGVPYPRNIHLTITYKPCILYIWQLQR